MILYIENPKDATRKLLEIFNEFGKVAGYKIKTQKSLVFLYTNKERSEREIKETLFTQFEAEHSEDGSTGWEMHLLQAGGTKWGPVLGGLDGCQHQGQLPSRQFPRPSFAGSFGPLTLSDTRKMELVD